MDRRLRVTPVLIACLVACGGFFSLTSARASDATSPPAEAGPPAPAGAAPRANLSEANTAVRASDYARADEVLSALVAEFPEDPAALLLHGEVLLALGKPADARPLLERTIAVDPERPRANFQLASVLQAAGELEAAIAHYDREIEINPAADVKIMAHLNRSILFAELKKLDQAAAALEAVLVLDPDRPEVYGDLATLYLQANRLDDAAAVLDRGFDEGGFSSAKHYYVLGTRYYQSAAYDRAVDAFSDALSLQSGFADAERSLGAALDQLGREAEAVLHLERYLALRPDAPEAAQIRQRIEAFRGKTKKG